MSKSNQSKVTNENPFFTDTSGAEILLNAVATKKTIEEIKGLHQYYRDCLVNNFEFPPLGSITPELVKSVIDSSNTDISGLADHLHGLSNEAMPPEQDRALRLMLMTILQANLVADRNNRFVDYTPHPDFLRNIKNAINRVLQLHNNDGFLMISVQLLYRINAIEAVLALSDTIPEIFQKYANLQAIIGFTHTALGNYETAMRYLSPLVAHPTHRDLPLVGLSYMTCQYFLGQNPSWPLTFKSLKWGIDTLSRQIKNLPPLEIIQPLPDSLECPIIFVACDEAYFFEHALYLAYSIHETNAEKVALHLHLFSPKASVLAEIDLLRERLPGLKIGVSVEYLDALKCHPNIYYSTVRFVRAYQLLLHYDKEMCMMDADSLVNQSWDSFATLLDSQTEIILAAPKMSPFWERIIAGFLYFKATPKGKFFMAKVSQFILQNIEENKAIWFTDQIALSVCNDSFIKNDSSVKHIDNKFLMDIHHGQQAFSWAITTIKTGPSPYESARVRLRQKYNYSLPLADLLKNKFTEVYEKNLFGGKVSRSGEGSNLIQTEIIRFEIPKLLQELNIKIFLDAPCGDWYWMREVNLPVERYIGLDIVEALVEVNQIEFGNSKISFHCINLIDGDLPKVDLIFSRDCLVHLSFADALKVVENFKRSGAQYLLTTTFVSCECNEDLLNGFWRPLNMQLAPFNFPEPSRLINEGCTEGNNLFSDKCLGLWSLQDMPFPFQT